MIIIKYILIRKKKKELIIIIMYKFLFNIFILTFLTIIKNE